MKKTYLALLCAMALLVTLAACGSDAQVTTGPKPTEPSASSSQNASSVPTQPSSSNNHNVSDGSTEGILYKLSADRAYALVTGYEGSATDVIISEEYNGVPVQVIDSEAFANTGITSVIIPVSVTTIGDDAFSGCNGLTGITIPASVTTIGAAAFAGCEHLAAVTFAEDSKLVTMDDYAFYGCVGLTDIAVPASVTTIGYETFCGCSGLETVTFAENSRLTMIDYSAFAQCASLASITIPASVTSISEEAFSGCDLLITEENDCRYVASGSNPYHVLIGLTNKNMPTYTIHEDTRIIADGVFSECTRISSITIPAAVTAIGENAFSGRSSLKTVTFAPGSRLTTIGDYAFYECSKLSSINFPDSVTNIGTDVLSGCALPVTEKNHCRYVGSGDNPYYMLIGVTDTSLNTYTIHEDTRVIAGGAFRECLDLVSIHIPASVTTIGSYAFDMSSRLEAVTFAENSQLTTIGYAAFSWCTKLTSIALPASVTTIGEYAFYDCTGITDITLPASVTTIGEGAFSGCSSLTGIHFGGTTAQWEAVVKGYDWDYETGNYAVYCAEDDQAK